MIADWIGTRPGRAASPYTLQNFVAPLLVAIGLSLALLVGIYLLPLQSMQDAGSWTASATGLHTPETTAGLSYVHTDGDASLRFPQTGAGRFVAQLRMGGPGATFPVEAHLATKTEQVDLGKLERLRVYHLLLPANEHGDVEFRIRSTTRSLGEDPRRLGVLLDWIAVRSLGSAAPPVPALAATPLVLALLWIAMTQLEIRWRWKSISLVLSGVLLCITYAIYRGRLAMEPWWIGAGLSAIAGMSLSRFDTRRIGTPLAGVALLFAVWRAALGLVGALGVWYGAVVYRYARDIASYKPLFGDSLQGWQAFAIAWIQWDGEHYHNIALHGYTFTDTPRPNIAFFPLYPLLIRLFLPITGNNVAVAALLVSNVALFAALLLLYDLVARDFDRPIADRTLVLLLVFPTSFFFVAGYSESLALALAVAALWAMRRQRWWLAGAAGGLLALTRLPGVMIAPVLAVAYLQHYRWRWRAIRPAFLAVLLPPLGLGLFMLYQWWRFDTPVAFLIAQQSWNNHLTPPWVLPGKIIIAIRESFDREMAVFQLCVWASFLGLTLLALRRLPLPYGLTVLLVLLPPYLAPQRGSLTRYVLIGFPAFVVLAMLVERRWLYWLVISTMLPLLVVLTLLFVNGFWVA